MLKILNPHDNGLRWSAHLRKSQGKEELQKRKAHITYGTVAETKVAFDLFSLFDLASSVTIPKHQTNTNVKFTE